MGLAWAWAWVGLAWHVVLHELYEFQELMNLIILLKLNQIKVQSCTRHRNLASIT